MTEIALAMAVVSAVVVGALWMVRRQSRKVAGIRLPRELRLARLWCAERLFTAPGPLAMSARVDRAYRTTTGQIVLLEFKTRRVATAYPSDVIELSAQRAVILRTTGESVADHGYVLVAVTGGRPPRRLLRVRLMPVGSILELVRKRRQLIDGRGTAAYASNRGLCQRCPYVEICEARR